MKNLIGIIYITYSVIIFISIMLLIFPFIILSTVLLKKNKARKTNLFLLKIWAKTFISSVGLSVSIKYNTSINLSKTYIYTVNHSSFLDAIAVAIAMPQSFSPLGKVEMKKIPIFGFIYSKVVITLDRKSRESRDQSVKLLKNELANGTSILIFPEGTMNRTSELLTEFYDGAFRIAIETNTSILPFVISNSKKLLPADDILKFRPGKIEVVFGNEIEVNNLKTEDLNSLKNKVRSEMYNMLIKSGSH